MTTIEDNIEVVTSIIDRIIEKKKVNTFRKRSSKKPRFLLTTTISHNPQNQREKKLPKIKNTKKIRSNVLKTVMANSARL